MNLFCSKQKIIAFVVVLGIILLFFLILGNNKSTFPISSDNKTSLPTQINENDPPAIVSTKPDPLNDGLVTGADAIEITFNRSIENIGEFKNRIEPKIEYKVELINERKTAKITPQKPWPLGTTFTLFINPDTKFDGVGDWGQDKTFHFRTIKYTGV